MRQSEMVVISKTVSNGNVDEFLLYEYEGRGAYSKPNVKTESGSWSLDSNV